MTELLSILQKQKDSLFSLYLISGNVQKNKQEIYTFLKDKLLFPIENNIDMYNFCEVSLSMDTAREIKRINALSRQSEQSFRIVVIETRQIEEVVQNALLKTFEEPAARTIFFVLLPHTNYILKTLQSRARIIEGNSSESSARAEDFFAADYVTREKMIENIIKKYIKERNGRAQKTRADFLELFSEIEILFLEKLKKANMDKEEMVKISSFYRTFLDLKVQARQGGSGIKNIFTYLAIYLPKI